MGWMDTIRGKFNAAAASLPIATGFATKGGSYEQNVSHSYSDMVTLGDDERVYSLTALCSSMAFVSVKGVYIEPDDIYGEDEITSDEKECINEAVKLLRRLNIREVFFGAAWNMIQFGDSIDYMTYDGNGVTDVLPLPIDKMTIVNKASEIGGENNVIIDGKIYVLNESKEKNSDFKYKTYDKEDVVHVSYNRRGQYRKDNMERDTYNVWSKPPIYTLKNLVDWKKQSITTDIKWKRKMVPREHWSVDTSSITPEGFQGSSYEEKIRKAKDEIKSMVESVKDTVDTPQPDQSIITTDGVTSKVLESSTANYKDPNEIIRQIDSFLGTPFGVPESFMGGESNGAVGTTMSALFSSMRMDVICGKIATEYEKVIRKHLGITHSRFVDDIIPRIKIRVNTALDAVTLEQTRIVLNMANAGLFSREEIRGMMGFNGIPVHPFVLPRDGFGHDSRNTRSSEGQVSKDASESTSGSILNGNEGNTKRNNEMGQDVRKEGA